jgi:hypothetical protein
MRIIYAYEFRPPPPTEGWQQLSSIESAKGCAKLLFAAPRELSIEKLGAMCTSSVSMGFQRATLLFACAVIRVTADSESCAGHADCSTSNKEWCTAATQ